MIEKAVDKIGFATILKNRFHFTLLLTQNITIMINKERKIIRIVKNYVNVKSV